MLAALAILKYRMSDAALSLGVVHGTSCIVDAAAAATVGGYPIMYRWGTT